MPNPINSNRSVQNNPITGFSWDNLNVGSIQPGRTLIVPVSLTKNALAFTECYINIDVVIPLASAGFQNIASTVTVAIYITLDYYVTDPTSAYSGKWPVGNALVQPAALYDALDPLLQKAMTLVPNSGFNYFNVRNFNLLNRTIYNTSGTLLIDDASKLLLEPGFFAVHPYYAFYDSRDSKGAITNATIYALQALTSFSLISGVEKVT